MWDDNETIQNGSTDHSKGKGMKKHKMHGSMSRYHHSPKDRSNTNSVKHFGEIGMGANLGGYEPPCSDCANSASPSGSGFGKGKSHEAKPA